ncbi:MAG: SIS domain-containing protein [Gemmatimonadales bacterium]|nr:SIS domain-containing protein [Gemmatimonadota bacterium]MCL4214336.1 SIS domain-containing protein [Gemmatimonadales bacterium]
MSGVDPLAHLRELAAVAMRSAETLAQEIPEALRLVRSTLESGGTLFFCGNGGSAADAQHIATEYVVRYQRTRRALRAIALTTDTSLLTAAANDFSFEQVFSRQVEALGRAGDLLVVHTTSGNSPNCLRAVEAARALGMRTLALTARDGGAIRGMVDCCLVVPTDRTDRAQELHLAIQHAICDAVDDVAAG